MEDGIITPAGIIIDGGRRSSITIVGEPPIARRSSAKLRPSREKIIDLSFLAGGEGGPLPPLVIRNCRLEGDLELTGSHFALLSLDNCQISRVNADHCQIDNYCRLTRLKSPSGIRGTAQIRMVAARIDGGVDLRGSCLKAPAPRTRPDPREFADRFALSLASAEIAGRLHLSSGFTALGGVSLYQATIRNSVTLEWAKLQSHASMSETRAPRPTRRESKRDADLRMVALDAEELKLSGSLLWVNDETRRARTASGDWDLAGQIVLRRAEIGGDCKFEHCRWKAAAGADDLRDSGGIDARLARVAGQFRIGAGCRLARWKEPPARRTEKDVTSGSWGAAFDAWKAVIGRGVRIEDRSSFAGPIFMNDSRIEHGFIMRGHIKTPAPAVVSKVPEGLDLTEARISGRVLIDSRVTGAVTLRLARVDGSVELHEIKFECPAMTRAVPAATEDRKTGCATILDLSSATISDALHIGALDLDWSSPDPDAGERPLLVDLRGLNCRIFDDNEAAVWEGLGDSRRWRLLLDGINFVGFDRSDPRHRSRRREEPHEQGGERMPAAAPPESRGAASPTARSGLVPSWRKGAQPPRPVLVRSRPVMLKAFASLAKPGLQRLRANVRCATAEEYSPQPYETFARAYFRDGRRTEAVRIAKERATLRWCKTAYEVALYRRRHFFWFLRRILAFTLLLSGIAFVGSRWAGYEPVLEMMFGEAAHVASGPWQAALNVCVPAALASLILLLLLWRMAELVLLTGWLFKTTFTYGLGPLRATITLAACLLLGAVVTNVVPGVQPVARAAAFDAATPAPPAATAPRDLAVTGCNLAGNGFRDRSLYAVDVFIPIVDLRQECAFTIAEDRPWLRFFKSLYALLGWVVVSMTLLTFSGVLRRDIEG